MPASGGEGGHRDGVHDGDRPRHRRAPRSGGRRRRHLLPQAGPAEPENLIAYFTLLACCPRFGISITAISDWGFLWIDWGCGALQKNVNEAVEGLRAKGITAVGAVCHVSDAQQRKSLIETAVKVRVFRWFT